jgi:undecaprenyl-diphosphatase
MDFVSFLDDLADRVAAIDASWLVTIRASTNMPWLDPIMRFFSEPWMLVLAIPLVAVYLWRGGRRAWRLMIVALLVAGATDAISGLILKNAFPRTRPNGATFSFPSSHAANIFGQATLFTLYYPRIAPWAGLVALLVSFSRLYLGKHYPSDVIVGAMLGVICGVLAWRFTAGNIGRRDFLPASDASRSSRTVKARDMSLR